MNFRIADTFTDSLARLTGDEQKAVKTTAFDLQVNPAHPGLSFHKLDRARDRNFWSLRVSSDIRIIVHRTDASLLLCYVDHHDAAYRWAERRKLETHPATGAAQLVEIRERVEEIRVQRTFQIDPIVDGPQAQPKPMPALFADTPEESLLAYGVPAEWLADVREVDEYSLLDLIGHLPAEAGEALLELATGGTPRPVAPLPAGDDPFAHPDAQRRFRVMHDVDELRAALDAPWEKWAVFLHPAQRDWVQRRFNGPARVSGSAGTGKTVVALHRAVHLARQHPDARVLLSTFSDTLAHALKHKLRLLIGAEPRLLERIEVAAMNAVGLRLYEARFGPARFVTAGQVRERIELAAAGVEGLRLGVPFLVGEWWQVVDAWQLDDWDAYRDVRRLGRKTRLSESQRAQAWTVFGQVRDWLRVQGLLTWAQVFHALAQAVPAGSLPFDFAVIDESQDIQIAQLRFLAALDGERPDALFFAGDLGQRIFQQPFSWKALGVDLRGRARTLKVNYRTSHQIRTEADRLLDPEVADVDGNTEIRVGTVSVFNGPPPQVSTFDDEDEEIAAVADWLRGRLDDGVPAHQVALFVREQAQLPRATAAVERAGLAFRILDGKTRGHEGAVAIATMHLAKGLEFRAVAVMACDDEVIPSQARVEAITDEADLAEVYATERHLLYVACTRARDHLLVSAAGTASEFLADLSD